MFIQKKIILIGKSLTTYGGNQLTSIKIYQDFIKNGYDITVSDINNNIALISNTDIIPIVDKNDIISFKNIDELLLHINSTNYEYIIVNKLDEYIDIVKNVNKKSIFITHNSMDRINIKLFEKIDFFYKIITVNNCHINNFLLPKKIGNIIMTKDIKCNKINKYYNCVTLQSQSQSQSQSQLQITNRDNFKFKNKLLYIGRVSSEKNIISLLNAIINLNNKHKDNIIELLVIGDGKTDIIVNNYPNVKFLGRCTSIEIIDTLKNVDYLILPSYSEGLPFAILEAFSCGIPVICSNINGCNELVTKKRGFLFDFIDYDNYKNLNNFDIINTNMKSDDAIADAIILAYKNTEYIKMSEECINYMKKLQILQSNNIKILLEDNYKESGDKKITLPLDNIYYNELFRINLNMEIKNNISTKTIINIISEMIDNDVYKIIDTIENSIEIVFNKSGKILEYNDLSDILFD